jgi:large subunit ribosomal protein L29
METSELRELTDEELHRKLAETKVELFNLRFQFATGQLDNPMAIKRLRRDIARIFTVIREKELAVLDAAKEA